MSTRPLPETFGRNGAYKVVDVIGRGGFATVYRAYHSALDRHVAIKVLHPGALETEGARTRFEIEARASARLAGHLNIVNVYDFVSDEGGTAYLILQFVDGETLETRLKRAISALEIDRIISGVASALDHAHRNNVLHRDIKPSNVLLDADGTAILTDFGIAKVKDENSLVTQFPVGTPYYMSPEQITGSPLDGRSDIYALGVMAYRIFAGAPPFQGAPMVILNHHVNSPVPPLSKPDRPVPAAVEQVIKRAMAKNPDDRYATAGQLADELRAALKPMILSDQVQAALRVNDISKAEGIVAELIRDHPSFPNSALIQREVTRLRGRLAQRNRIGASIAAENWQAALDEIERGGFRSDDDPAVVELVRRADTGLAAARRAEQERQAQEAQAAERQRQQALEADRRRQEAADAEWREQEAREAARREWETRAAAHREQVAREAARRDQEARESARREEEARDAARRAWEAQEAERQEQTRRERERQEQERQEQARQEASRLEAERQEQARREAARLEQQRQDQLRREEARQEQERRARSEWEQRQQAGRSGPVRPPSPNDSFPRIDPRTGQTPLPTGQTPLPTSQMPLPTGQTPLPRVEPRPDPAEAARLERERRIHEANRQARLEELAREVDEESGLPPQEIAARAAERHRQTMALRAAAGLNESATSVATRPKRSPALAIAIGVLVVVVLLGAGAILAPNVLPSPGFGSATATPTRAAQGPVVGVVTPAPATATMAAKPGVTGGPTSAPASVPTTAPTTAPTTPPTAPPGAKPTTPATAAPKPTTPPTVPPTAAPAPLPPTIAGMDGAEGRLVAAGAFTMGKNDNSSAAPSHSLTLPAFYLDTKEVTNAMFAKFVQQSGYQAKGDWRSKADGTKFDPAHFDVKRDPHPVVNVTWDDAAAYCSWAGRRLPTEAEWEKAARGADGRLWPWGNEPHPEFANVDVGQEEDPDTKAVGSHPRDASPFGILDLAGNVREWTSSAWHDYPLTDPSEQSPGADRRVVRGASGFSLRDAIEVTRRIADPTGAANKDLGFRCAVSADQATRR